MITVQPPARTGWVHRRAMRIIIGIVLALALLLFGLWLTQALLTVRDWNAFPPPGRLVDAGGHRLHLNIMGEARPGVPTVVLEAGSTSFSAQWAWIQSAVAQHTQVVAYDRAGAGWSEPSGELPEARLVAEQLRTALQNAGVEGPYILVGHSFGGLLVRVFRDLYPDRVAGLVLLDPVGPELMERLTAEELAAAQAFTDQIDLAIWLARFGVLRVYNPLLASAAGLPERQLAEMRAKTATPAHLAVAQQDLRQSQFPESASMMQLRAAQPPGDLPLIVITRTMPDDHVTEATQEAGASIAAQSTRGSHMNVAGADHFSQVMNEEHAQATIDAIQELVADLTIE